MYKRLSNFKLDPIYAGAGVGAGLGMATAKWRMDRARAAGLRAPADNPRQKSEDQMNYAAHGMLGGYAGLGVGAGLHILNTKNKGLSNV